MWNTVPYMERQEKGLATSKALSRGLRVIGLLAAHPAGLPLTEIASQVDIPKGTCHRLLQTLVADGYALQDDGSAHYRLTFKMLWTVSELLDGLELTQLVRPTLDKLSQETSETVHLALLDGNTPVYVSKIDSPNAIRMYSRVGKRMYLHSTGLGKAILAYLPEERVDAIINADGLPAQTTNTITEVDALKEELACIRARGYALDEEENEDGIHCIAAPVFDQEGAVVGAVSIAALKFRIDKAQLVSWWPELERCAQDVGKVMRHYLPLAL